MKTLIPIFAVIFFYTMDIKNTIFNPKFYQHFLPSLLINDKIRNLKNEKILNFLIDPLI